MSPSNRVQPRAELAYFAALIMRAAFAKVHVSNHVEVVVIDVDHFDGVFVNQGVWERPANDFSFREVGCNLEVHVVQLSWSKQRIDSWWIDVISDLFFYETQVVALLFVQEWNTTLNTSCSFESPPAFVVAR